MIWRNTMKEKMNEMEELVLSFLAEGGTFLLLITIAFLWILESLIEFYLEGRIRNINHLTKVLNKSKNEKRKPGRPSDDIKDWKSE